MAKYDNHPIRNDVSSMPWAIDRPTQFGPVRGHTLSLTRFHPFPNQISQIQSPQLVADMPRPHGSAIHVNGVVMNHCRVAKPRAWAFFTLGMNWSPDALNIAIIEIGRKCRDHVNVPWMGKSFPTHNPHATPRVNHGRMWGSGGWHIAAHVETLPEAFGDFLTAIFTRPAFEAVTSFGRFVTFASSNAFGFAILRTSLDITGWAFEIFITFTLAKDARAVAWTSQVVPLTWAGIDAECDVESSHVVGDIAVEMNEHVTRMTDEFGHASHCVAVCSGHAWEDSYSVWKNWVPVENVEMIPSALRCKFFEVQANGWGCGWSFY